MMHLGVGGGAGKTVGERVQRDIKIGATFKSQHNEISSRPLGSPRSTHLFVITVIGSVININTILKTAIRTPPASGTLYAPFGPFVALDPTKMILAIEMRIVLMITGMTPL